jgi:NtrC-family two-component system response regulator AlgB
MRFLVIDDDKAFRDAARRLVEQLGHHAEVVSTGSAALETLRGNGFDSALLDITHSGAMDLLSSVVAAQPELSVVVTGAGDSSGIKTAVEAMRRGATDFLEKSAILDQLPTVITRVQRYMEFCRRIESLEEEVREARAREPAPLFAFHALTVGSAMEIVERAARTTAPVLLLGESGTGKTVAARWVHGRSHLADQPFVTVSCPSLSRELLASELFGHVRGAFTGALKDHWGRVKAAEGGTLFLDEIGDLPLEVQPKLLRLLQEQEYERLGENITRRATLRLITATNRDLKERVRAGAFREDLYYRLNVISIELPPLRARRSDILFFADHYLRHFANRCGRKVFSFRPDAAQCFTSYHWPGNLRELCNSIERAVILARNHEITLDDLPAALRESLGKTSAVSLCCPDAALLSLDQLETLQIRRVLAATGSITKAAKILGIDQATLYRKRKKLAL